MRGHATFLWQTITRNKTTGAVAPSSRRLCRKLAKWVGTERTGPIRVFEAGPGTGVATREILAAFQPEDRLVIYEANPTFVEYLHKKFETDPFFAPFKEQVRLVEGYAQDCDESEFDHAVCGIPFTNFDAPTVQMILQAMFDNLKPGGTLSYFEYWGMRKFRQTAALKKTRERLKAVQAVTDGFEHQYDAGRDLVLLNMPPATAHHLRKPS